MSAGHSKGTTDGVRVTSRELQARLRDGEQTVVHEGCKPVAEILARVGDKWSVLTVMLLGDEPKRFNEMRRLIGGISQRMLTLTLRGLERDGFVTRTVYPTVPPKVEYALTDLGRSLLVPISQLGEWAFANRPEVVAARARFDAGDDERSDAAVRVVRR